MRYQDSWASLAGVKGSTDPHSECVCESVTYAHEYAIPINYIIM